MRKSSKYLAFPMLTVLEDNLMADDEKCFFIELFQLVN